MRVDAVPSAHHQYYAVMTKVSWTDAQTYCRVVYTDLATISSNLDWNRLKKVMSNYNLTSSAWVGLYNDINSWRWSLSNVMDISLENWNQGEPDNNGVNQSCGFIDLHGNWYGPCLDLKPAICYSGKSTS